MSKQVRLRATWREFDARKFARALLLLVKHLDEAKQASGTRKGDAG